MDNQLSLFNAHFKNEAEINYINNVVNCWNVIFSGWRPELNKFCSLRNLTNYCIDEKKEIYSYSEHCKIIKIENDILTVVVSSHLKDYYKNGLRFLVNYYDVDPSYSDYCS